MSMILRSAWWLPSSCHVSSEPSRQLPLRT